MDWSNHVVWLLVVAVIAIVVLFLWLTLKNQRLRRMAAEAERLRHEANATEQRNRQLKQEMTSNIAHELKTPVSSILGYLEILLGDHPIDEERRRHYLERCLSQAMRLSDLIQDVSLINKIEESSDLFPIEDADVQLVAQEAFDELIDRAAEKEIGLRNSLTRTLPIKGNHELLYGIFRNLTENAIAYAGSHVEVAVEEYKQSPTHYYIHFYDTGNGVPNQYLPLLFDRFVRIGEGRSRRNGGGTGLGLSIVKHAVLFHGGEIYARNRQEGGLEYFFSLKKIDYLCTLHPSRLDSMT